MLPRAPHATRTALNGTGKRPRSITNCDVAGPFPCCGGRRTARLGAGALETAHDLSVAIRLNAEAAAAAIEVHARGHGHQARVRENLYGRAVDDDGERVVDVLWILGEWRPRRDVRLIRLVERPRHGTGDAPRRARGGDRRRWLAVAVEERDGDGAAGRNLEQARPHAGALRM